MPDSVKADATKAQTRWSESTSLTDDIIAKSDVLYVTRVQKERFDSLAEYEAVKDLYVINNDVLAKAKESCIVMHPLPRNNEIDPEVDFDTRRAAYFRQMRYGLFVSCPAKPGRQPPQDLVLMYFSDPHGPLDAGYGYLSGDHNLVLGAVVDLILAFPHLYHRHIYLIICIAVLLYHLIRRRCDASLRVEQTSMLEVVSPNEDLSERPGGSGSMGLSRVRPVPEVLRSSLPCAL